MTGVLQEAARAPMGRTVFRFTVAAAPEDGDIHAG